MKDDVQYDQDERPLAISHLVVLGGSLLCSDVMGIESGLRLPEEHDRSAENSCYSID